MYPWILEISKLREAAYESQVDLKIKSYYLDAKQFFVESVINQAKLEAALLIALEALEKIIKKDKYEAIFPQGPAIAEEALNKIQSLGEK